MGFSRAWAWLAGAAYAGHMKGRTMKGSRNRSVPVVAAMAALGLGIAAVSCAGSGEKAPPKKADDKTRGPAIAKGDKDVEKPGAGQPAAAGKTPAAPAKSTETAKAEPKAAEPKAAEPATPPKAAEPAPAPAKAADGGAKPAPDAAAKGGEQEPVPPPRPG